MGHVIVKRLVGVAIFGTILLLATFCQVSSDLAKRGPHVIVEVGFIEEGHSWSALRSELTPELDTLGPLVNGKKHGEWVGFHQGNLVYREYYSFGKLISGETFTAGMIYGYDQRYALPQPFGSDESFLDLVRTSTEYPSSAQSTGHQGEVRIRLHFDSQGNLIESKVVKKFGFGCEKQILEAVKEKGNWSPGIANGTPVESTRVLRVRYRLVESMVG